MFNSIDQLSECIRDKFSAAIINLKSAVQNPKSEVQGRQEGRPYPRSQYAIHEVSGLQLVSARAWCPTEIKVGISEKIDDRVGNRRIKGLRQSLKSWQQEDGDLVVPAVKKIFWMIYT